MENYSHGSFVVTGYSITTSLRNGQNSQDIQLAWEKFLFYGVGDEIMGKLYPTLHVVYYNYTNPLNLAERGYDMLIGFITEEGSVQTDSHLTSITIPAQDYKFLTVKGNVTANLLKAWEEINAMTAEELPRTYQFDIDMYNEDMSEVTVTVSV